MMAAVPASDLPNNAVPSGDLPDHLSPPPGPQEKTDFRGAAKAFGKELLGQGVKIGTAETGAEAGAALGALGGVAAPVTVPLGAVAGGVAGYLAPGFVGKMFPKAAEAVGYGEKQREGEKEAHPIATQLGALPADIYGGVRAAQGLYSLAKNTPAIVKGVTSAAKGVLGVPSRSTEQLARDFEAKGFKLEPAQLKADVPSKSPGFMGARISNQKIANKLASETTGAAAPETGITDKFLSGRFDALGKEYDKLVDKYPGWAIDRTAYDELGHLVVTEERAAAGQVRPVEKIAADIRNEWQKAATQYPGQQITSFKMDAKTLKRYMSELKKIARSSSDGTDKYAASQAIHAITGSLGRSQPELAADLAKLNQQYRSTVALDELAKSGGIRGGNISLSRLGDRLKRLEGNPLYDLGLGGRELNLAARWEGAGPSGKVITPETILSPSKLARTLATGMGLRSQAARNIQREFTGD